jgi:hypothetical protein
MQHTGGQLPRREPAQCPAPGFIALDLTALARVLAALRAMR